MSWKVTSFGFASHQFRLALNNLLIWRICSMKKKILAFLSLAALLSCGFVPSARGSTITVSATEEAMVQSGQPNLVWDPKGAIEFSGNGLNTAAPGNTEYGLMEFNSASIVSQLNSTYPGGWTITGVSVSLAANFATAGVYPNNSVFNEIEPGNFTLSWLSNNGWVGGQGGYLEQSSQLCARCERQPGGGRGHVPLGGGWSSWSRWLANQLCPHAHQRPPQRHREGRLCFDHRHSGR